MIPTFSLFVVMSLDCCEVIPVLAVLAATSVLAETNASVYPTLAVLAVIADACWAVIPVLALLAVISLDC